MRITELIEILAYQIAKCGNIDVKLSINTNKGAVDLKIGHMSTFNYNNDNGICNNCNHNFNSNNKICIMSEPLDIDHLIKILEDLKKSNQ